MYQSIPNQTVLIIEDSRYTNGNCQQLLQDDARPPYRLLTQPYDRPVAALCQAQQIDGIVLDVCAAPLEADARPNFTITSVSRLDRNPIALSVIAHA